ncbi:hypothetical protein DYB30_009572 [Aphanomyces astaci]|uniref:Uncharacterized protein n=1 Tax=Aphanomyces astaci TaxID=112090 RepID=A0A397E626_APHAT|nr:hypothetical protein DYB30_009572 [Aphanomyces astaci]
MGKAKGKAGTAAAAPLSTGMAVGAKSTTAKASLDALFATKKTAAKVPKDAGASKLKTTGVVAGKQDKKTAKHQLDALFSGIKAKKQQKIDEDNAVRRQEDKELAEKRAYRKHLEALEAEHKQKNNDSSDPRPGTLNVLPENRMLQVSHSRHVVRYDADGLPIYSEESLRLNQGGETADCPFDCWCCF